jgi:cell division protein FtsB
LCPKNSKKSAKSKEDTEQARWEQLYTTMKEQNKENKVLEHEVKKMEKGDVPCGRT